MRKNKKKRSDGFFGIHFDFHANKDCDRIGEDVTEAMVQRIIDVVDPDYLQIDCKGHPGYCSYPTQVGNPAPGFVNDPLIIWRQVTEKYGIPLIMHYSGIWDAYMASTRPEWARIKAGGIRENEYISLFSPYVDEVLIPQLKELNDRYGVDGVWVDGDCWAVMNEYDEKALAAYRAAGGSDVPAEQPGEEGFEAYTAYTREVFRKYLRHYTEELKRHNPDFQITSNYAFSSYMPEPVTVRFDYLSGDITMGNSFQKFRLEARCLAGQTLPWDLMAWSFCGEWGSPKESMKSSLQLQQEAATALAFGGGFQIYVKPNRNGSVNDWHLETLREVAEFCRARERRCHRSEAIPQIALFYSSTSFYRTLHRPFGHEMTALSDLEGVLYALLESQYSVEVKLEHQMEGRLAEYPLIVVPEWPHLPDSWVEQLAAYAEEGGRLLLVGPATTRKFESYIGVRFEDDTAGGFHFLRHEGRMGAIGGRVLRIAKDEARPPETRGQLYPNQDVKSHSTPAAFVKEFGKGTVGAVLFPFGERYKSMRVPTARRFLASLTKELFPLPIVEVVGSSSVDVVVNRNHGNLQIHLIHAGGAHENEKVHVYDEIPPLGPLQVAVRPERRPERILRFPDGESMRFTYEDGVARFTIDRLGVYDIIAIE